MWLMASVYCVRHPGCIQFFEDQSIMAIDCTSQTQVCVQRHWVDSQSIFFCSCQYMKFTQGSQSLFSLKHETFLTHLSLFYFFFLTEIGAT